MLRGVVDLLTRWGEPPARERAERAPYRHELLDRGFRDPVVFFDLYRGWEPVERAFAERHALDFEEAPRYLG